MRISRKKRPQKLLIPHYRTNEDIDVPEVRVIDSEGNNIGLLSIKEAIERAFSEEKDLVEINPKANPPVTQIIEYSHFKYQKEKEVRKQKVNAHVSELKGIRLSIRIGVHDMEIRTNQAQSFLERGDKVKVEIILRDRERAKTPLAFETIRKFYSILNERLPVRYEQEVALQGNKATAIIARR